MPHWNPRPIGQTAVEESPPGCLTSWSSCLSPSTAASSRSTGFPLHCPVDLFTVVGVSFPRRNLRVLVTEVLEFLSSLRTVLDFSSYLHESVPASPHLSDRFSQRLLSKHALSVMWSHACTCTRIRIHTLEGRKVEKFESLPIYSLPPAQPTHTHTLTCVCADTLLQNETRISRISWYACCDTPC